MSIFNSYDTRLQYRYKIKKFSFLFNDGEEVELDYNRVVSLSIDNDYDNNYFPIMKVKLALNTQMYYKILNNKNNCKVFIRMTKFAYKNNDNNVKTPESIVINKTFNLILTEGTDNMNDSVKRREESGYTKIRKEIPLMSEGDANEIDFYLYSDNVLNSRKIVNGVFTNVTVSDVITKIFNDMKVNRVCMVQPDNITKYKELLIPPIQAVKALSFIDTYYGIYKEGSIIYLDFDICYIVPYNGRPYLSNNISDTNITNIVIPSKTGASMTSSSGQIKKKYSNESFIISNGDGISINNSSISNDFISGNNALIIDGVDGINDAVSNALTRDTENNINVIENETMNPYIGSMYSNQTSTISDVVTILLEDFDIDTLLPSKVIRLMFEDSMYTKKYKGSYILSSANHSLIKNGGELQLYSSIGLKKS